LHSPFLSAFILLTSAFACAESMHASPPESSVPAPG
jgi:hypothetical protein